MVLPDDALEPSVEFAILADAVQAAAGKLYVLGGGWDTLFVAGFPARHHSLGIAVRVRVPWTWADRTISMTVDLQDEDGTSLFERGPLTHVFSVRRPPGLPDGSDIGLVRAFTFNNLPLPHAGGYSFRIGIEGVERDRLRFTARERPVRS